MVSTGPYVSSALLVSHVFFLVRGPKNVLHGVQLQLTFFNA
jgi:hypothetical protein